MQKRIYLKNFSQKLESSKKKMLLARQINIIWLVTFIFYWTTFTLYVRAFLFIADNPNLTKIDSNSSNSASNGSACNTIIFVLYESERSIVL